MGTVMGTRGRRRAAREVAMTGDATPTGTLRDTMRAGVRDVSAVWWWFLILGVLWTLFGMYVLSYRVGSLAAVAGRGGVSFLFGGITQLVLGAWAARFRRGAVVPLLRLVRGRASVRGDSAGFAAFSLREGARRVQR